MAKKQTESTANLPASMQGGKRIGGDDAKTHEWTENEPVVGRLDSVTKAGTRYGARTRAIIVDDAGEVHGLWLPERWEVSLTPYVGKRVGILRIVEGLNKVTYNVRAL